LGARTSGACRRLRLSALARTIALSLGWLISFAYRRLIANPDPPLPARGEPQ